MPPHRLDASSCFYYIGATIVSQQRENYNWLIADYNGQEDDTDFLPVANGEVVRVIQKGAVYYQVEKDDEQGKVPFECL
ncbi:MAG: hypothetical protein EZS28_046619 [Streblomastix strix]|uniref:SH3 domain-containing protein n=1 Tax=Streblomastix strix TaxID=222440 RepID=A0A5J4THM2_9EUKA|nr:MAG: hypothetical protein EZS28_046619 [Streblomastix strix]